MSCMDASAARTKANATNCKCIQMARHKSISLLIMFNEMRATNAKKSTLYLEVFRVKYGQLSVEICAVLRMYIIKQSSKQNFNN